MEDVVAIACVLALAASVLTVIGVAVWFFRGYKNIDWEEDALEMEYGSAGSLMKGYRDGYGRNSNCN